MKVPVLLTRLMTLTMRFTSSSVLPAARQAAASVPMRSMAMARAAALPSSVVVVRPSWPTQGLPSFLAMWPLRKMRLPVCTNGT
ncbi:hypothetical protein FQZ97_1276800 [compost metagenome]